MTRSDRKADIHIPPFSLGTEVSVEFRYTAQPLQDTGVCVCGAGEGWGEGDWRSQGTSGSPSPQVTDQGLHSQLLLSAEPSTLFSVLSPDRHSQTSHLTQNFVHSKVFSIEQERTRNKSLSMQSTHQQLHALAIPLTPAVWPTFDHSLIRNYLLCQAQTQMLHPESPCYYWWLIIMQEFFSLSNNKKCDHDLLISSTKLAMLCFKENT